MDGLLLVDNRHNEKKKSRSLSPKIRYEVLLRDGFKCQYCGNTQFDGTKLEIDHIVPYSKGGSNDKDNLITSCFECNRGKSDVEIINIPTMQSLIPIRNDQLLLQNQMDYITYDEFKLLLNAVDAKLKNSKRPNGLRNQYVRDRNELLLMIMWNTGARISDVLGIKTTDIDNDKMTLTYHIKKKQSNIHTISLDNSIMYQAINYIHKWKIEGYLFKSGSSSKTIRREQVHNLLREYSEIAMIRPVHAHLFRHGIAMYLLKKGVPMEMIAYRLGHSNVQTTAKFYARIDHDVERGFIEQVVPNMLDDEYLSFT